MKKIVEALAVAGAAVVGWLGYRRYESVKPGDTVSVPFSYGNVTYNVRLSVASVPGDGTFTASVADTGGLPAAFALPAVFQVSQAQNLTPRLW
jgi:hypothetical protein